MKNSLLRPYLVGLVFCGGALVFSPAANAAPKPKDAVTRLQIWPGQRTLVVLPLTFSEGFLSADGTTTGGTGSEALGRALAPLVTPQLSGALESTGKFSITRPYKFDPLVRRAVAEQRLQPEVASAYVDTPSLSVAQNVLGLLGLDQPGMVAQIVLQNLRVGGTAEMPTVQMTVRGDLYEAGGTDPFRSITVTSKPFGGKSPEDRLRGAAGEAFADIANAFVAPPTEFELPLPTASSMMTAAPGAPDMPAQTPGGAMKTPMKPMAQPIAPTMPMAPNGTNIGSAPVAPQLPAGAPPLGVNVPAVN